MKSALFSLERMDGQDRLFEALEMRGFLVKKEGPFLTLSKGSADRDYQDLKRLLNKLGLPVFWNGDRFQLLVNRLPVMMMKKITTMRGHEFPIQMSGYHFRWRAFVNRRNGLKVNTLDLDPRIAMLVKAVNQAGISCLAGCDGHMRRAPHLKFSGAYTGAWFSIVQKRYFDELTFHYQWEIRYDVANGSALIAKKNDSERWDMKKIYEDALTMAYRLKEVAEEVKEGKQRSFKRNKEMKNMAESLLQSKEYDELAAWMEQLAFQGE